jgi:type I restriction enzyme S subunit
MSEWTVVEVGDIAELAMGQSPPGHLVEELNSGLPFLQGNAEFGAVQPSPRLQCDAAPRRCERGDLLISVRAPVGEINVADQRYGIGRGLGAVRFGGIDRRFGVHAFTEAASQLHRVAQGTTFAAIGRRELAAVRMPAPVDDTEQRRIAEILDTSDELVRSTELILEKHSKVHAGLVCELFEKSAYSGGWPVHPVADVVDPARPVTYGIVQPGPRQREGEGVPIIRGQDYSNNVARLNDLYWVLPSVAAPYRRATLRSGDLLLSIVGVYVGTVGQVPLGLDGGNITQTTARIAIRRPFIPRFFFHQLMSPRFQLDVRRYTKGSAQPGLNLADVEHMRVSVPPVPTQEAVATILDSSFDFVACQRKELDALRAVQVGIAADLLSGRVRTIAS